MSIYIRPPSVVSGQLLGTIETYFYATTAVAQGTWEFVVDNTNMCAGHYVHTTSNADADEATFHKVNLPPGTYTVRALFSKASSYGILKVYAGSTLLLTLDSYNGSTTHNNLGSATGIALSGEYALKLKVDGKNGSSSGYAFAIQNLIFERTA